MKQRKPYYNSQKNTYFDGVVCRGLQHGDYDSLAKKYYNAETERWITRKLSNMYSELPTIKVTLFSAVDYSNLKHLLGSSVVDRVKYFLTFVYRSMLFEERNTNSWVYISTDFIRVILSYEWSNVVDALIELGILESNISQRNPYNANKFKRFYRLSESVYSSEKRKSLISSSKLYSALKRRKEKIVSADSMIKHEQNVFEHNLTIAEHSIEDLFRKRFARKRREEIAKLTWDTIGEKRTVSIRKKLDLINSNEGYKEYREKFFSRYEVLRDLIISKSEIDVNVTKNSFGNRVYNPIIQSDREFREIIYIDNQPAVEVDMVTGYSSLFALFLYHYDRGITTLVPKEVFKVFSDEMNVPLNFTRDFLEEYGAYFSGGRHDFYWRVGFTLRSELMKRKNLSELSSPISNIGLFHYTSEDRGYIKDLVIRIINSNPSFHTTTRFFNGLFSFDDLQNILFGSHASSFLNQIKSIQLFPKGDVIKLHANITYILIYMEQKIMGEIKSKLIKEGVPYVSLHDGLLVAECDKDFCQSCCNSITNKYGYINFKSK